MAKPRRGGEAPASTQPDAEGRASASAASESAENGRQLRRLAAFLEDGAGFQLALVTYDTSEVRDQQLERLAERLQEGEVWLTRLDLTETPQEKQLLDRLREHLAGLEVPDGKRPAVMIVGLEATLDYRRLGPDAKEGMAILENANAQRDAFARECPASVALWLNPTATSVFAARAPDLWHWRNGTFHFTAPGRMRLEMEHRLLEMPLVEADGLARKEKLERIASLRDLLAELSASPEGDTRRGRQRRRALLVELGLALLALDEAQQAISVFQESRGIAREIGDRRGEGNDLGNLGTAYSLLGEVEKAIPYHEQHLQIAREICNRRGEGNALGSLGSAYLQLGQVEKGMQYYEESLLIHREIGDRRGELKDLGNLGTGYRELGQIEKAIAHQEQALAISREIGDRRGEGYALGNLGTAYADLGRLHEAIRYYEERLSIAREIGERRAEGVGLGNLGMACAQLGQLQEAIRYFEERLSVAREIGERRGEGAALANLGLAYGELGQIEKAVSLLEQGLRVAQEIADPENVRLVLKELERLRLGAES